MHSPILLTVWSGILGYMHACMQIVTLCGITPNIETDFVTKLWCIQYKQRGVHNYIQIAYKYTHIQMLTTDRDKYLFNLYIFQTVPQKNISFIKFVKFNEYAST